MDIIAEAIGFWIMLFVAMWYFGDLENNNDNIPYFGCGDRE